MTQRSEDNMSNQESVSSLSADDISIGSFEGAARNAKGAVVIIDVFRAFTTAAIALANGARRIIMVDDIDKARALREENIGRYCIGERKGIAPPGFDFGNSPAELLGVRFDGDTIIQTTSNGTRGILAATRANRIYADAFVSATATVRSILTAPTESVTLVAMGEYEKFRTDEDELCALYLRGLLLGRQPDPASLGTLMRTMSKCADSTTLSSDDVNCCLDVDSVPFAIRVVKEEGFCVATAETASG
jgi:2-phosphosulfolactate phosphatase